MMTMLRKILGVRSGGNPGDHPVTPSPRHPVTPSPRHRRGRWFNFGPGIAIALILSGFVLYTRWEDGKKRQPPRIERTVAGSTSDKPGGGIAPEIFTLLARREALELSGEQVRELGRLHAEWERVSAPKRQEAERAATEFQQWMGEAQQRQVTRVGDIQERGAALSALSAEVARERRTYWQSALQILTAEQRERALSETLGQRAGFPADESPRTP